MKIARSNLWRGSRRLICISLLASLSLPGHSLSRVSMEESLRSLRHTIRSFSQTISQEVKDACLLIAVFGAVSCKSSSRWPFVLSGLIGSVNVIGAVDLVDFIPRSSSKLPADFLHVPEYLTEQQDLYDIVQLRSYAQEGPTCGWFTLLNAYAIDTLYRARDPITSEAVCALVDAQWRAIKKEHVTWKNLAGVSSFGGLSSFAMLRCARKLSINLITVDIRIGDRMILNGVDDFESIVPYGTKVHFEGHPDSNAYQVPIHRISPTLQALATSDHTIKHFCISATSRPGKRHVALLSIVPQGEHKPLIIYMDSNNKLLSDALDDSYVYPFFVQHIIRALGDLPTVFI